MPLMKRWLYVLSFFAFACFCFFFTYRAVLLPVLLSAFWAYVFFPLVNYLIAYKVPRTPAISLVLFATMLIFAIAVIGVVPFLYHELQGFVELAPKAVRTLETHGIPWVVDFISQKGIASPEAIKKYWDEISLESQIAAGVEQAFSALWQTAPRVLGTAIDLALVPLLTFFFLKDGPHICLLAERLIPDDMKSDVRQFLVALDQTLRSLLKGHLAVAGILAVLYAIGLSAVGVRGALAIGLTAGLCRMIPYFDLIVGGTLSLLVVLSDFSGMGPVIGVAIVFGVVQVLDGMLVTPKVIGKRAGLHPVVVIISIIALGSMMGFWGVITAIPLLAIAKLIGHFMVPVYKKSRIYLG